VGSLPVEGEREIGEELLLLPHRHDMFWIVSLQALLNEDVIEASNVDNATSMFFLGNAVDGFTNEAQEDRSGGEFLKIVSIVDEGKRPRELVILEIEPEISAICSWENGRR
jgi:hypothetical protein